MTARLAKDAPRALISAADAETPLANFVRQQGARAELPPR
jgi:hypothetical protein